MKRNHSFSKALYFLIVLLYMYICFQRGTVPGQIFNELAADFSLGAAKLAKIGTLYMLVYAFAQVPCGILIQKYGGIRVLVISSILLTIGGMAFPFSNSYATLLVSRILVGLGCSFVYPAMIDEANKVHSNNFTSVVGISCLCGFIASAMGTVPFVYAVHHFGWRASMLAPAILGLLVTLAMLAMAYKVEKFPVSSKKLSLAAYWETLTNRNDFLLITAYTVNFGIYYAVLAIFGKKFLEDACGMSAPAASLVSMLLMIAPALYNPFTGTMTARIGNKRRIFIRIMGLMHLSACGIILLGLVIGHFPGRGLLFSLALVTMSLVGGMAPVIYAAAKEYSTDDALPIITGLINFSAYGMVFIFGTIAGYTMELVGGQKTADGTVIYSNMAYIAIFAIFVIISALTCKMSFMVPETYGKNILAHKNTRKHLGITFHY